MAESNATLNRSANLRRDILVAANSIYRTMFSKDERHIATFQFLSFIGWRSGPDMPKPARRGSQNVSFKDIGKIIESQ
jgi:NADH dehydrogenase [ubiquinone] 1 alpha subcomplex assembly factor 5